MNPERRDPYKSFKFRIRWGASDHVAGISTMSPLKRATGMVGQRGGGDPDSHPRSASRWEYEPITLEYGVTHDPEFANWARRARGSGIVELPADRREEALSLKGLRRELTIDVFDEAGNKVDAYRVRRAWVSEISMQPELDADAVAIARLTIEHEGWERDEGGEEPPGS